MVSFLVLFIAFEPHLRRIVYMRIFKAANILTALASMKRVKAIYKSRVEVLTDGHSTTGLLASS